jgi:two-component system, NtrC family, response regulator AtoC
VVAPRSRVLLIEDEALFAKAARKRLQSKGHECYIAETLAAGRELAASLQPDLILLDLRLPDGDGLLALPELAAGKDGRSVPVIIMTAFGEVAGAVFAIKNGAVDYLKKPVDLEELNLAVEEALKSARLKNQLDFSREREGRATEGVVLIGESPAIKHVVSEVAQLAAFGGSGNVSPTVLVQGETGTGKDVVARLLHHQSRSRGSPFVHVDCAALPRELIEAELFGHEKGAYTSAGSARTGLIEAAEDGSLFLDEIGELPLELQAKLLNVIERRVLRRIGSVRERPIAARFIAASNRILPEMIAQGSFRADLYFRLNVMTITLPPLRERGDDVVLLARHYGAQTARRYGLAEPQFEDGIFAAMREYSWPGNVRELKHLVERAVLLCRGKAICRSDLALPASGAQILPLEGVSLNGLTLDEAEKILIEQALERAAGNVSEAARRLGVSRMALRYRMEKHRLRGNQHS